MSNPSSGPGSGQLDNISGWSLIRPYWVSEERRTAWGLLITIIAIDLLLVGINAQLNTWNRDFYNALEGRNLREFPQLMLLFSGLAFAFVAISVYNRYLRQMPGFRWRQWLTTRYLHAWLGDGTFYRIERDRLSTILINGSPSTSIHSPPPHSRSHLTCSRRSRHSSGSRPSYGARLAR